jgi:hypothetical protein
VSDVVGERLGQELAGTTRIMSCTHPDDDRRIFAEMVVSTELRDDPRYGLEDWETVRQHIGCLPCGNAFTSRVVTRPC